MFEDEARVGPLSEPRRCWAAPGTRPRVCQQQVREYTDAYGAVSPLDGITDFLILPVTTAEAMALFLAEIAHRHQHEYRLLLYDGSPCHSEPALTRADNIEHLWDEIEEKFFHKLAFEMLECR